MIILNTLLHNKGIMPDFFNSKGSALIIMFIFFLSLFIYFAYKKRYEVIEKKYAAENERHKIIGGVCIISAFVVTLILFFAIV